MLNRAFSTPNQARNDDVAAMVTWVFGGFGYFFFFSFFCVCVMGGLLWCGVWGFFAFFFERGCLCSFHWFDFQHLALKCSVSVLDEDTEVNKNVLTLKLYEERCN